MFSRAGLLLRTAKEFRSFSTSARLLKTHYDTLGLKPAATAAEIKNAYYEKTKMYHPDTSSESEESIRKFREISEAYEVLGKQLTCVLCRWNELTRHQHQNYNTNTGQYLHCICIIKLK